MLYVYYVRMIKVRVYMCTFVRNVCMYVCVSVYLCVMYTHIVFVKTLLPMW